MLNRKNAAITERESGPFQQNTYFLSHFKNIAAVEAEFLNFYSSQHLLCKIVLRGTKVYSTCFYFKVRVLQMLYIPLVTHNNFISRDFCSFFIILLVFYFHIGIYTFHFSIYNIECFLSLIFHIELSS